MSYITVQQIRERFEQARRQSNVRTFSASTVLEGQGTGTEVNPKSWFIYAKTINKVRTFAALQSQQS